MSFVCQLLLFFVVLATEFLPVIIFKIREKRSEEKKNNEDPTPQIQISYPNIDDIIIDTVSGRILDNSVPALDERYQLRDIDFKTRGTINSNLQSLPCEVIENCIICHLPMCSSDEVIACPVCGTLAHRTHYLEWIKIKGYCPHCETVIKAVSFLKN